MPTISPRSAASEMPVAAPAWRSEISNTVSCLRAAARAAFWRRVSLSSLSSSSPASRWTIEAWSNSATGPAPTTLPSRNTETFWATRNTSPRWWVTYSTPTPVAAIAATRSSRWSTSSTGNVAVGSSRTSRQAGTRGPRGAHGRWRRRSAPKRRGWRPSPSGRCRGSASPGPPWPARGSPGPGSFRTPWGSPSRATCCPRPTGFRRARGPAARTGSRAGRTARVPGTAARCPPIRIPPPGSGAWYPDRILIRVDLPDPF